MLALSVQAVAAYNATASGGCTLVPFISSVSSCKEEWVGLNGARGLETRGKTVSVESPLLKR